MKGKKKNRRGRNILFLGGFSSSSARFFRGQSFFLLRHALVAPVEATKAQPHVFVNSLPLSLSLARVPSLFLCFSSRSCMVWYGMVGGPLRLYNLYFPSFFKKLKLPAFPFFVGVLSSPFLLWIPMMMTNVTFYINIDLVSLQHIYLTTTICPITFSI